MTGSHFNARERKALDPATPLTERQLKNIQPPTECICGRKKMCMIAVQSNGVRFTRGYCLRHAIHKIKAMRTFLDGREAAGTFIVQLDPGPCDRCHQQAHVHLDEATLCAECALDSLGVEQVVPAEEPVDVDPLLHHDPTQEYDDGCDHQHDREIRDSFPTDDDDGPLVRG